MPETDLQGTGMPAESSPAHEAEGAPTADEKSRRRFFTRLCQKAGRCTWHVAKKAAYVCFVLLAVVLVLVVLDVVAKTALSRSHMGAVYPDDIAMAKRDLTKPVSHYDYDLNPGVCLVYNQTRGGRYEYANNAGFREPRDIPVEKPADEFRIFLTGGSAAFGLGSGGPAAAITGYYHIGYAETISHTMEKILNATAPIPGKTIRVYNTGVWGYSYQHLLMRYVTKLRSYKPDLVVSLDGVNEIGPVSRPAKEWDYYREGQYNAILRQIFAYNRVGLASYITLWLKNNTYLMTLLWSGADIFQNLDWKVHVHTQEVASDKEAEKPPSFSQEERRRILAEHVATMVSAVDNYHSALQNDGVPHIFALQPMLYLSKKPRHEMEKKIEPLNYYKEIYDLRSDQVYQYIVESIEHRARYRGYFVADFTDYFHDTSEWVFSDWCHLTAGANYLIAKELSNLIKEHFFQKPPSDSDKVDDKDSFFWNMASSASVVYAPQAEDPGNEPKNMLLGNPAAAPYSSKIVPPEEPLEVVLDLGREFKMSRLRLVWADEESVPETWAVDVSKDEKSWTTWVEGSNRHLDKLTWWPGYEYYGANFVEARYVRYRPIKTRERKIGVRSLTILR